MITTNLLNYFQDLRENYDNFKNIEGFVADDYWEDTDYIPDSFKQGNSITNPCYKYNPNPNEENQLDQECVKKTLEESTSPEQTVVLKKVFGIDTPASTTPVTTVTPTTSVTTITPTTPDALATPTTPDTTVAPTIDNLCSGNILDFQCNKNLKIVIWCLIILCALLVISFIVYIMYNSKQKEHTPKYTTPVKHLIKNTTSDRIASSPTTNVSFSPLPPVKYQNTDQRDGFLKRMIGGKTKRKN
jgi:hypothetical protein